MMRTNGKRSKISKFPALALCLAVVGTVALGAGFAFAADPAPQPSADQAAPPEVVAQSNVAWDNHVQILELRHEAAALMDQIRHKVQELREAGVAIPEETRSAIKDCKDAIRASQEVLRGTVAQMEAEFAALHEDRQAKNWAGVLEHLGNIIEIQEVRLTEGAHILGQLQTILSLLNALG